MRINFFATILVFIGLMQSFGHILQNKTIKQIGMLMVASPLPIVFTQQKGFLETFALKYTLLYKENGTQKSIQITPELYAKLDKPYNYRNVLGAAIAYGPILPKELVQSVLGYAFVSPAPVSKAFGIHEMKDGQIELIAKTKNVNKRYLLDLGGER